MSSAVKTAVHLIRNHQPYKALNIVKRMDMHKLIKAEKLFRKIMVYGFAHMKDPAAHDIITNLSKQFDPSNQKVNAALIQSSLANDKLETALSYVAVLEHIPKVANKNLAKAYGALIKYYALSRNTDGLNEVMDRVSQKKVQIEPEWYKWIFACMKSTEDMEKTFREISKDLFADKRELYSSLVKASALLDIKFSFNIFNEMKDEGYKPGEGVHKTLIRFASCAHSKSVDMTVCEDLLTEMRESMMHIPVETYGHLTYGYTIRNDMEKANSYLERVLSKLEVPIYEYKPWTFPNIIFKEPPKFAVYEAMMIWHLKRNEYEMFDAVYMNARKNGVKVPSNMRGFLEKNLKSNEALEDLKVNVLK